MILLALSVAGATYAWFTFASVATVDTQKGHISSNGVSLLISNSQNGPFAESCDLVLDSTTDVLRPVTTQDLNSFYVPVSVDLSGNAKDGKYKDVTEAAGKYLWFGRIWLQANDDDCRVQFDPEYLYFGEDETALASMRCGIRFYTLSGVETYIFETTREGVAAVCAGTACTILKDEIAMVDYWLYLDGDDPDCKNDAQSKDIALQLGFIGNGVSQ